MPEMFDFVEEAIHYFFKEKLKAVIVIILLALNGHTFAGLSCPCCFTYVYLCEDCVC